MPYDGEYAKYGPLKRIAQSERVQKLFGKCKVRVPADGAESQANFIPVDDFGRADWQPEWIIAVDGSHLEVKMENGFPGAEISYITVASVILNLKKVVELDQQRPVDPKEFRKTEQADSIDSAFPGCNMIIDGEVDAKSSLRRTIFETLAETSLSTDGESLLDTYEALLELRPRNEGEEERQRCPYEDCKADGKRYQRAKGKYDCKCPLKRSLYSTDGLRVHEGLLPAGSSEGMFSELMSVLERIWVVHILRTMEAKGWLSSLRRVAFVVDGPLAVYRHPAWVSQSIIRELARLNQRAREVNDGQDILLLGVEKTGQFVDHFVSLDTKRDGSKERIPSASCFLLPDKYIKQNIIFSESEAFHGAETYFGRKFFYKTRSGAHIVATVPFLKAGDRDLATANADQFPRLRDALTVLDRLVSSRYPSSLAPLISAHAEASIPLHLGTKVLEKLARDLMRDAT